MSPSPPVKIADLLYLPPIAYFVCLRGASTLIIDPEDPYRRQTERNRTKILLANKTETLSVPVMEGRKEKAIKEVKIDYRQKWLMVHLRGIKSAYGKSPFFEYFYTDLEQIYLKKNKYLFDLNWELLTLCLKFLGWSVNMVNNSSIEKEDNWEDMRGQINSKRPFEEDKRYHPHPYGQIFGANFVPNLSVVDLLFCEGPMADAIIARSNKSN